MTFYGNITTEKDGQYLTFDTTTPFPWDHNLGVTCSIQSRTIGNSFMELFMIRENNYCKAVHKYLGEFWYDIERAAQLPPGVCPVPAGKYHVQHVKMDFTKISLQTFPFGRLRFVMRAVNNKNMGANMFCLLTEVDNLQN